MSNTIEEYSHSKNGFRFVCKLKDEENNDVVSKVTIEIYPKSFINFLCVSYSNDYEQADIYFDKSQVEWLKDILNEIDLREI